MTAVGALKDIDLRVLDSIDSTNDAARRRLAEENPPSPFVIAAREQTKGRGRSGRAWQTISGNLAVTFFLPYAGTWQEAARLGFAVSLGVRDAIVAIAPDQQISLKWPNDVLLNNRKVCGILLENIGQERDGTLKILIGIGINLATHPDPAEANWTPTSILAETGTAPDFDAALALVCKSVPARIAAEQTHGFPETRKNWMALAARRAM